MTSSTLKIVVLMAGYGTRLRPHTWSRPKQLLRLADKMVIDHLLDTFTDLPKSIQYEFIFVVGYLGDKIEKYMGANYPDLKVSYVEQAEMRGQSHAISLAKDYLDGPMLVIYGDTLMQADLSFLAAESAEAVAWVKAVPDPRRFGVASLGKDEWVTNLVEKPQDMDNNLVLVGCYYFKKATDVLAAIDEQIKRNITLKDEFYFADAINIMLERGLKMRVERVDTWLDAGTPDAVLSTNRYYLDHGHDNTIAAYAHLKSVIRRPVFIHPTATIEDSVIGPYASIGANCKVQSCIIRDSIIDDGSVVSNAIMERSMIGRDVHIERQAGVMNIGDQTELSI